MASISALIRRQNIALILIGIAFSSLGYYLWLRSDLAETHRTKPSDSVDLIYPLTSRGSTYFITPEQATELGILKYLFAGSFVAGVLLTKQTTQTARLVVAAFFYLTDGMSPYRSEELKRSLRDRTDASGSPALFFISIVLSFAVFWISISRVASVLVLKGVTLRP
jgi:hypothetical protein